MFPQKQKTYGVFYLRKCVQQNKQKCVAHYKGRASLPDGQIILAGECVCSKLVPLYQDDSLIWFRTCPRQKIKCNFYPGQLLTSVSFQFTRKAKPEERPQTRAIFQRSQVIRNLDQLADGEWVEKTVKVAREWLISGKKKKQKKNSFAIISVKSYNFR